VGAGAQARAGINAAAGGALPADVSLTQEDALGAAAGAPAPYPVAPTFSLGAARVRQLATLMRSAVEALAKAAGLPAGTEFTPERVDEAAAAVAALYARRGFRRQPRGRAARRVGTCAL
jgi:hypothetical protein